MERGLIFDIAHGSYVDGPGTRTTVFFKGCNLRCAWCHNPESQSAKRERLFYADQCKRCGNCRAVCSSPAACTLCGSCEAVCTGGAISFCGREVDTEEVMEEILSDRDYYGNEGGVTFSGGECLLQPEFLLSLLKACKKERISTAVDTAGNVERAIFEQILPDTDLFLYDVKCMDKEKHRLYTGVTNEQILSNLSFLLGKGAHVIVRVPVVGGVNDTAEEMKAVRDFLSAYPKPDRIELLPYHRMGENKYKALGRQINSFTVPTQEQMEQFRQILK